MDVKATIQSESAKQNVVAAENPVKQNIDRQLFVWWNCLYCNKKIPYIWNESLFMYPIKAISTELNNHTHHCKRRIRRGMEFLH